MGVDNEITYYDLSNISDEIWFHIIKTLSLTDIRNLSLTSKYFYELCKSNTIWWRFIFTHPDALNRIVLNYNIGNFPDLFHFNMFVDLDHYFISQQVYQDCIYYDLVKKICSTVEYFKPPYYFRTIRKCVRENYLGHQINFTSIPVDNFNGIGAYDHQIIEEYDMCEIVTNFKKEANVNEMRIVSMNRYIRPLEIPAGMLRKNYVIVYPETVRVLFMEQFGRFDEI